MQLLIGLGTFMLGLVLANIGAVENMAWALVGGGAVTALIGFALAATAPPYGE